MIEIDKTHESNIIEKETKEDIEKISVTDEDEDEDLKDFLDDDIELE
jgi:hypothetical protein